MSPSVTRPRTASRRRTRTAAVVALTGAAAVVALSGCSGLSLRDDICSGGEYPVMTIGGTGSGCVKNGTKEPKGYTRYPEGKVPQKVDDKWDVYWRTHTVDKKGDIIDAPDGE
ncbi:SCO0607 family lipoprotein [Streptomyces sp. AN091965]|uniref:SCO0607 family lipoprotein n=1 Tax=Streptomyces sp. AN091965 TaxID=2927803 RepID=UPI001F6007A5|nr:hypothetical protein [Streptomyces sp. AN091965]MCI3935124.1 hypothetical protein [Streptomyces sp. AN091965]